MGSLPMSAREDVSRLSSFRPREPRAASEHNSCRSDAPVCGQVENLTHLATIGTACSRKKEDKTRGSSRPDGPFHRSAHFAQLWPARFLAPLEHTPRTAVLLHRSLVFKAIGNYASGELGSSAPQRLELISVALHLALQL
ncbi:unnamed protein product [Protopolystoma xenopodis]|uniref:Uncharacterized protein n=1 Tax=Protopolystoma xenopodis TaxID=117903 RepID=A0A448XHR5_9PLAT|nr:unnamed protein product [Protopolystoma xenopodis]